MRACPSWATGCVTCCASIALPQERDGEEADDEGEGEDVPEHEARRRRGLTASARRVQKLRALEKANPYGVLPVVYLTDLYNSKRFEHVDAGLRYAIVVHVLHHHQRHVLQGEDDAVLGPAPYLRRHRGRSEGSGKARFAVAAPPKVDAAPIIAAKRRHPWATATRAAWRTTAKAR